MVRGTRVVQFSIEGEDSDLEDFMAEAEKAFGRLQLIVRGVQVYPLLPDDDQDDNEGGKDGPSSI